MRLLAAVLALVCGCPLTPLELPDLASTSSSSSSGGGLACSSDADCSDGNACTIDACQGGTCAYDLTPQGVYCGDGADNGDACDGTALCNGQGTCAMIAAVVVDDGDACTADSCDPKTGDVTHQKEANCLPWLALPEASAPSPRERHTAIWTGSKMIVWGGDVGGNPSVTATGGVFDPVSRVWTSTSMVGAPSPRHSHSAAWTGSKMIVWGGYGASSYETSGALYDPATDAWTPITSVGAPAGRTLQVDVWTGSELLVWGGDSNNAVASGGRYNPATDAWSPLPGPAGASARYGHSAVWTGDRMIMWGGSNSFDWLFDGALYNPSSGSWTTTTATSGAPEGREGHTAIWTGSAMVVWGGWNGFVVLNTGGIFDPAGAAKGTWIATSTASAPSPRDEFTATWTGSTMLVWGGCGGDACKNVYGDGGVWTPDSGGGAWAPVAEHPALGARRGHTAVWTGSEVIVWGGRLGSKPTNTGAQAAL